MKPNTDPGADAIGTRLASGFLAASPGASGRPAFSSPFAAPAASSSTMKGSILMPRQTFRPRPADKQSAKPTKDPKVGIASPEPKASEDRLAAAEDRSETRVMFDRS